MDKKDLYIKAKLQEDKEMSNRAKEVFKNFEGGINLENNNKPKEKKVIKISLKQAVLAFSSLMIVAILGGNLYAHMQGMPNLYSAIKGLFVKEDKYTASEIEVNQTVESNGIKLTLKTVAMDENILITKYIAEGEKLENEFYTYPEFEEGIIKYEKIRFTVAGWETGENQYEDYTLKDGYYTLQEIISKLENTGLTADEARNLVQFAIDAYHEYIGAELGAEDYSSEKAKGLITETIAMFESKVSSKYEILQSSDKLQDCRINAISQKIERSGNQYIIYNVYNVDAITDLASKFNLSININKIGSIEGTWNFSTELEKARLDTRVETIDFYENNSCSNVAPTIAAKDNVLHAATVEAKRLVISDFSTVLMLQTRVKETDREFYLEYADSGLPCVFVITDENNNTVGTGTCSKSSYESATNVGGTIIYTDRIVLENVGKDTKKLYVKIYEQYNLEDETIRANSSTIVLDIETARNAKKPVELIQSYASKEQQISFKYPVDWKVNEEEKAIKISGPEDLDGNIPLISISKVTNEDNQELKTLISLDNGVTVEKEGETTVAGVKGYYRMYTFADVGHDIKGYSMVIEKDGKYYKIDFTAVPTQYARYEETFKQILETIEAVEPEKSYRTFSDATGRTVIRLYEDNTLTIQFTQGTIAALTSDAEGRTVKMKENVEYTVSGIKNKIVNVYIGQVLPRGYHLPMIFVATEATEAYAEDIYYINVIKGLETAEFTLSKRILENVTAVTLDTSKYAEWNETDGIINYGAEMVNGPTSVYLVCQNRATGEMTVRSTTSIKNEQEIDKNSTYKVRLLGEYVEVRQKADNTIAIKWNEKISASEEVKQNRVKMNEIYNIGEINGTIKEIYEVHKDRQGNNIPTIYIRTEDGKMYTIKLNNIESDTYLWKMNDTGVAVETVIQSNGTYLTCIGNSTTVYTMTYDNVIDIGFAPSHQVIYDCLLHYCAASIQLSLKETIENAFENITYIKRNDGNYVAEVRVKIYDSSINETKVMEAVVVYDTQNNNFKIESFDENPKGGVGY